MSDWETLRDSLNNIQEKLREIESKLESSGIEEEIRHKPSDRPSPSEKRHTQAGADSSLTFGLDLQLMNSAIQKLADCQKQEQILETFLQEAQSLVNRGVLFLKEEYRYVPWKTFGLELHQIDSVNIQDHQHPVIQAALQTRIIVGGERSKTTLPWSKQADESPGKSVCIPLSFQGFVPVVFWGDSSRPLSLDTLELLSHLTVLVLKNHYLQQLVEPTGQPAAKKGVRASDSPPTQFLPEGSIALRPGPAKEEAGTTDPQPLETDENQAVDKEFEQPDEATESTTCPVLAEPEKSGNLVHDFQGTNDPVLPESISFSEDQDHQEVSSPPPEPPVLDVEELHHAEARRLSRLLVSEIKLENAEQIILGRENKDLYSRLKEKIENRRKRYEEEVDPGVSSKRDYYHEEVVRILAAGDDTAMGDHYPGRILRMKNDEG